MRRPLVAGNWKMNGARAEASALIHAIVERSSALSPEVDLLVLPPFTVLDEVKRLLDSANCPIWVGAQDLHWEPKGAFTGEISAEMLREAGASHVLVGHSERRTQFGEAGITLLRKLRAAHRASLVPILCIGEDLDQRSSGQTEEVLDCQLDETLLHLSAQECGRSIVAYEPVWAIGTGRTATPEQAEQAHRFIRERIAVAFGGDAAEAIRIVYGGSVNPSNASMLLQRPGVDGALVGGSSLQASDFVAIVRAAVGQTRG